VLPKDVKDLYYYGVVCLCLAAKNEVVVHVDSPNPFVMSL